MRTNPFRPNSPINPGMFVGRVNELGRLEQVLIQTMAGEPGYFMIRHYQGL